MINGNDKPGYKEIYWKNYGKWSAGFIIAALALVAANVFTDSWEGGWIVALILVAIAVFTFFYGRRRYRKDFKGEIRKGEYDSKW